MDHQIPVSNGSGEVDGGGGSEAGDSANGWGGSVCNGGGTSFASSSGTKKLTTDYESSYMEEVKDIFKDQREKYVRFLDIMNDFKTQRVDTAGVIGPVKELFEGHPNLILGFNIFLPKGYEIILAGEDEDEGPPRGAVEFQETISFVAKIKDRYQDNVHVYRSFLEIVNSYRKGHKSIAEAHQEVASLFDGQPDLFDEFITFLPDTSSTAAPPSSTHASLGGG